MLTEYIEAAMRKAKWDVLSDNTFYAEIPDLPGVHATDPHLEACLQKLRAVLEEWIILTIQRRMSFPEIDGVELRTGETG